MATPKCRHGSDAWVFAALGGPGREKASTLRGIVGYADSTDHAILLEGEFVPAIGRLTAVGLADADAKAGLFWLTEFGHLLREEALDGLGAFGWIDALPAALESIGPPVDRTVKLPRGAFDRAVRDYLRRSG